MATVVRAREATPPVEQIRHRHTGLDYGLLLVVGALLIIGLMMAYSTTFDWSYQKYHNSFYIASRQFLWVGLGVAVLAVVARIPYDRWRQWATPVMGVTLVSLVLVLLVGERHFGAQRSFFNGSIQPGELAKLAVVIYLAAWLSSKGEQIRDVTYGVIPFAVLIGIIAGLIVMQPDLSMAILVVLTALAMFFFAGADIFQLSIGGAATTITFLVLIKKIPYAQQRINEYVQIWHNPRLVGYHVQQALVALGSGGLFGVGLGQSQQKLGYLPVSHTDSIFAVLGEELGLFGCLVVITLFVLLACRGFKIALHAPDAFAALLASGVTCWLTFQALLNVAVMTGLLPFTGVALPFISSGGSPTVVSLAGIGLLLSISRGRRSARSIANGRYQVAHLDRRWGNRGTRLSGPRRRTGADR